MRLLLVNPNVTERITDIMAAEARRSASHTTEIVTATARFGTPYIENRAEAAIAAHAVLDTLADRAEGCDAAIVSAFGDPGLAGARELFDFPVVGISEAALLMAWTLGRRHAIVCLTPRLRTWYMECATEHGLSLPWRWLRHRRQREPFPSRSRQRPGGLRPRFSSSAPGS
jgi:Asp/Glu/hydantoin racemase